MVEILAHLPNPNDPTSFYRGAGPLSHLRQNFLFKKSIQGVPQHLPMRYDLVADDKWKKFREADVVLLQRPFNEDHLKIAKYVKRCGRPLWVDHDDLVTNLECDNDAYLVYEAPVVRQQIEDILGMADLVTVSTHFLKQSFSSYNKNIWVVPNAFDNEMFNWREDNTPRKKIIFWRGTHNHAKNLMSFTDAIVEVAHQNPEWEWHFMGLHPFYIAEKLKDSQVAFVQMEPNLVNYFRYLYEAKFAVQIVTLTDTPFNRAKSNNAYIEGTMADSVVLAPNWEEWQAPGAFNYNDTGHFTYVLNKILKNYDDVKKSREMAWRHVKGALSLNEINKIRVAAIESLL